MATEGYFDSWVLYVAKLELGLVAAPDPAKTRILLHNSTLIGAAATKAELIAAELPSGNGYSRYTYTVAENEVTYDEINRVALYPERQWIVTAGTLALQYSGVAMLADAADEAPEVCTATPATDRINLTAHGLTDGDEILLTTQGSVFGGLTSDTIYYVVNATADDFQVEAAVGGGAIDLTDTGSGDVLLHYANGRIVMGLTLDSPSVIAAGQPHTFIWDPIGAANSSTTTGDSWQ
jgi:hypothetical protein